MRSFIAIDLIEEETRNKIIQVQEKIDATEAGNLNLVKPENFHITMKFLGDINESEVKEIKEVLNQFKKYSAEELTVNGIGVFPHYGYIKVIWAGLESKPILQEIKSELETKLANLGFETDDRDFKPHITIGRVKDVWAKDKLVSLLKDLQEKNFGVMNLDKIKLKKSTLTSEGPIYETISEVELK